VMGLILSVADRFAQYPSLLDVTDPQTFTSLEHAARRGHTDVIRVCLRIMRAVSDGSLLGAIAHRSTRPIRWRATSTGGRPCITPPWLLGPCIPSGHPETTRRGRSWAAGGPFCALDGGG